MYSRMCSPQWLSHMSPAGTSGQRSQSAEKSPVSVSSSGGISGGSSPCPGPSYDYLHPLCLETLTNRSGGGGGGGGGSGHGHGHGHHHHHQQMVTFPGPAYHHGHGSHHLLSVALPFEYGPGGHSPLTDSKGWYRQSSSCCSSSRSSSQASCSGSDSGLSPGLSPAIGLKSGRTKSVSPLPPYRHERRMERRESPYPHFTHYSHGISSSSSTIDKSASGSRPEVSSSSGKVPIIHMTNEPAGPDLAPPTKKRKHPSGATTSGSKLTSARMSKRISSKHDLSKDISPTDKLSRAIWEHYLENRLTEETKERKMALREMLYNILKVHFPIDLYIVGSSLNGLGNNSSDLDLCMVMRNMCQDINQSHAIPILKYVNNVLLKHPFIKNTQLIIAKVPILKLCDSLSGIEMDLNVNNIVGIRNTQLIKCYTRLDRRVQPLVITIKTWAKENEINDAHNKTISSYTYVLMVIHYLQFGCSPPVLPCLHKLMPGRFLPESDITTLNLYEPLPSFKSENKESLGELLFGFFDYYAQKFQYKFDVVSVRKGEPIPKYVAREFKACKNTTSQWKYICVEEPFDRTNTARSVYDEDSFNHILSVFRRSFTLLKTTESLDAIFYQN